MKRYVSSLLLTGALLIPAVPQASLWARGNPEPARQSDRDDHAHRYYDRAHKDYHEWNDQEQRAYRHWLEERRENYRDFAKAQRKQQELYWKWRHDHPGEAWERR